MKKREFTAIESEAIKLIWTFASFGAVVPDICRLEVEDLIEQSDTWHQTVRVSLRGDGSQGEAIIVALECQPGRRKWAATTLTFSGSIDGKPWSYDFTVLQDSKHRYFFVPRGGERRTLLMESFAHMEPDELQRDIKRGGALWAWQPTVVACPQ